MADAASGSVFAADERDAVATEPPSQDVVPAAGSLMVTSRPPAAKWYLDGAHAGITPGTATGVARGVHRVTIKLDGYEAWSQSITVYPGEESQVSAFLRIRSGPVSAATSVVTSAGAVPSEPGTGQIWVESATGMEFAWVPSGCYLMGSPTSEAGHGDGEAPQHEVCVDGFWMGRTEVTNAQYRRFVPGHDSGHYEFKILNDADKPGVRVWMGDTEVPGARVWMGNRDVTEAQGHYERMNLNGDDQPVVGVSWSDAQHFIMSLNRSTGRSFRLPTEAEWEYAARGGTTHPRYWGEDPSLACGYANVKDKASQRLWTTAIHECDDGYAVTAPVGRFRPNNYGLYDMLGNVEEWCADWLSWDYYARSPRNNPTGPPSGVKRVTRGGSYCYIPDYLRAAVRGGSYPDYRVGHPLTPPDIGFRLVTR